MGPKHGHTSITTSALNNSSMLALDESSRLPILHQDLPYSQKLAAYICKASLWKITHQECLAHDILIEQNCAFNKNKYTWFKHIENLKNKYNLPGPTGIAKAKWTAIVKKVTKANSDLMFRHNGDTMSKLANLMSMKDTIKPETYIYDLSRSDASIIFKLRSRMLPLRNNCKGNHDTNCQRCRNESDDEQHLFSVCSSLVSL